MAENIHRDLKPNNVLVVLQDGKPVPKIIDGVSAYRVSRPAVTRSPLRSNAAAFSRMGTKSS